MEKRLTKLKEDAYFGWALKPFRGALKVEMGVGYFSPRFAILEEVFHQVWMGAPSWAHSKFFFISILPKSSSNGGK